MTAQAAATAVDHVVTRDQVIWGFGPDLEPVLEVEPGAIVRFETNDCFTGQIQSEADLVSDIDFSRVNSATGPVAVRGAEPGDSLVVELLEIRPGPRGFATIIPEFGQLIDAVKSPVTYVFDVDEETIRMNDRISFPLRPMVGVVGVATDGEEITNGWAGRHGGNLDDHKHGPGGKLFFPVRQPGGMFAVGDMHASMGDGEICGTGVEIGGEVVARFDVLKGKQAVWPVTELPDAWLTTAPPTATSTRPCRPRPRKRRSCSSTSGASRWRRRSSFSLSPATSASARPAGRHRSARSRASRSQSSARRRRRSARRAGDRCQTRL